MTAKEWISSLQLSFHPEGGAYRETYRSAINLSASQFFENISGSRNICTSIYFLLQKGEYSAFHRIRSDEIWYFHDGGELHIIEINTQGKLITHHLGKKAHLQVIIPAGSWFAAVPAPDSEFCLAGCAVSPGFDFADFELAKKEVLVKQFPPYKSVIEQYCKKF